MWTRFNFLKKHMKKNIFANNFKKVFIIGLTAVFIMSGFFVFSSLALADPGVTISSATGGSSVSIDTSSAVSGPAHFTPLTPINISEAGAVGQISAGTHIFTLPSGWEFNTSAHITAIAGDLIIPSTADIIPDPNSFSFTVTGISTSPGFLMFMGMQVRPTGTVAPTTGEITHSGAPIAGVVDGSTSFGTLTTVAGAVTKVAFTTQPGSAEYRSNLSPQPVVKTQDQFGNNSTNGLGANKMVTLTLTAGTGALQGTASLDIGTSAGNGTATFSDLTMNAIGAKQLTASADGLTPAVSTTFEITKKTLTASVTVNNKTYDGDNSATITNVQLNGVKDGDNVVVDFSGATATFIDKNAGTGKAVSATGITITGVSIDNYTYDGTATGAADITAKAITITPNASQTKVYGQPDPTFTYTFDPALIGTDSFTGALGRGGDKNVGTYAYTLGTLFAGTNYTLNLIPGTFAITQRTFNVSATGVNKVYDAGTTATVTLSDDRVLGDNVTLGYTAVFTDKNIGTGKTVNVSGISISGVDAGNYILGNTTAATTANITAKPLTVSFTTHAAKTYDGTAGADIMRDASLVLSGVIAPDVVSITGGSGSASFADKHIGSNKTVTATGFTLTGDDKGNYIIGTINTTTGNVNSRPITVTAVTDSRIYNGTNSSVGTPIITSTFSPPIASGDTANFIQTYDNKNVGTGKVLTPSGSVTDGNSGNNYTVTPVAISTGAITKKPLTATITVANKVYNGSGTATITGVALIGVESGDAVNADFSVAIATFANASVGDGKIVTASGITISGDVGNYSYDGTATGIGNILPIPTVVYVNGSWAGTILWADPDGTGPATAFGYDAFSTIQDGISAVNIGGTVNVATGTYVEVGQIVINKNLSIVGTDKATTIIKPAQGTNNVGHADSSAWILVNSGITFNLSNVTLDGSGQLVAIGILSHGHGTINNNILTNIAYNQSGPDYKGMAIELYGSDMTVSNNNFSHIGRIGVFNGFGTNSTISGNTYVGKGPGNWLDYAFEVGRNGQAAITGNTISNNIGVATVDNSTSAGILVTSYYNPGTPSQATITNNTITNCTDGIAVGYDATDGSIVVAHGNILTGNGKGINSTHPAVNGTQNWWGTAVKSTIQANITGSVTFEPYYVNSGKTTLSNVAVTNVYVDDNYSDGVADTHIFGYDAFNTIQEGINAVADNGTINVVAGTYNESVLIEKKLTLVGSGETKPVITGLAPANYIVKINGASASGSVIDNVEINGGGVKAGDNGFDYGILIDNSDGVNINNCVIKNVWKNGSNGIGVEGSTNIDVYNNVMSSFHKRGIRFINSTGTFYANQVIGDNVDGTNRVQNLVNLWGGSNVEIYENMLHNALTEPGVTPTWDSPGIFVSSYGGSGPSYANIHNNEIYDCDSGIVVGSVYAAVDNSTADIVDNYLHNLKWAINFEVNTVSATITGNSFANNKIAINAEGFEPIAGPVVNAEGNWWGRLNGPTEDEVFANVDYRPWCVEEICTTIDSTPPTVTISFTATSPTKITPIPITVTFSEAVYDFAAGDITVANGAVTGDVTVSLTDPKIYTFNVTPTDQGLVKINIPAEKVWDQAGNYNTIADQFSITYDTVAPIATLVMGTLPPALTNLMTTDITVAGVDVTYYKYKLDSASYSSETPVATHITLSGLADGPHTLLVIGRDVAGNWQAEGTATIHSWTIDKTAPTVTLTNTPANLTNQTATNITVGGTEVTYYKYKLDSGSYSSETAVTTPITLTGLSEGAHTLSVIGRDVAGNWQAEGSATSYSWTIDTTVPTIISYTPSDNAVGVDPTGNITVTFSEPVTIISSDVELKKSGATVAVAAAVTFDSINNKATIDPSVILDNNSTYTMIVKTSVADLAGNGLAQEKTWSFTTSGSYNVQLTQGWNLISMPVIPNNTAIVSVLGLAASSIEAVWAYDAVNDAWYVYRPTNPSTSNLASMTAGYGYWVNYTSGSPATLAGPGNLFLEGNYLPPQRTLKAGWNLIGYYQKQNTESVPTIYALKTLKNPDTDRPWWTMIMGYNNNSKQFTPLENTSNMDPGNGYWILMGGRATDTYIYAPGETP
jgi:hypothetical protein